MPGGSITAKIDQVVVYRCVDEAIPSRNNIPTNEVWSEGDTHQTILKALDDFIRAPVRCNLLLVLSNGIEINIVPSLKVEVPAMEDEGYREYWDKPVELREPKEPYELCLAIWPIMEDRLGLPPADYDEDELSQTAD